jgi:hypothetical protein
VPERPDDVPAQRRRPEAQALPATGSEGPRCPSGLLEVLRTAERPRQRRLVPVSADVLHGADHDPEGEGAPDLLPESWSS